VRRAGVDLERGGGDEFWRASAEAAMGTIWSGVAVQDESGDVEFFEILGEVGLGRRP